MLSVNWLMSSSIFLMFINYKLNLYYFSKKKYTSIKFNLFNMSEVEIIDVLPTFSLIVVLPFLFSRVGFILSAILVMYTLNYTAYRITITTKHNSYNLKYPGNFYLKNVDKWSFDFFKKATILSYLQGLLKIALEAIKTLYKHTKHDILVGFFIIKPTKRDFDEFLEENYKFQKRFFKTREPLTPDEAYRKLTDEERANINRQKKLSNGDKNLLLRFQRLPLLFDYSVYYSEFLRDVGHNVVIIYSFFKTVIFSLVLSTIYFMYTIFFFKIQFLKQLSIWFVVGMMCFWLMSGFNFFLKRYQYGKFTSAIQRFWKRTNTYFWLIEGFLILLFFYYYLNSSQEPVYMYDYSSLNQEYLISLHVAGVNVIILSLIIYLMYFTMLRINSNSWTQLNLYLMIISLFIFYSFFIETYQFYYVLSTFNERFWNFNEEENLWVVEIDNPILRTKHHYLLVCLIAKYWHFLFIFLSWVFFLIKSFERRKITYVLFAANLQNIIILYVLNFACYLQWFKWVYRRFADLPYTWFMTSIDTKLLFRLFFELKLLFLRFLVVDSKLFSFPNVTYKSLSLWTVDSLAIWKFI